MAKEKSRTKKTSTTGRATPRKKRTPPKAAKAIEAKENDVVVEAPPPVEFPPEIAEPPLEVRPDSEEPRTETLPTARPTPVIPFEPPVVSRDSGFAAGILEPSSVFRTQVDSNEPAAPPPVEEEIIHPAPPPSHVEERHPMERPAERPWQNDRRDDADAGGRSSARGRRGRRGRGRRDYREPGEEGAAPSRPSPETDKRRYGGPEAREEAPAAPDSSAPAVKPLARPPVAEDERGEPRSGRDRGRRRRGRGRFAQSPMRDGETPKAPPAPIEPPERSSALAETERDEFAERLDFEEASVEQDETADFVEVSSRDGSDRRRPSPSRETKPAEHASTEKREMLINVSDGDECRIALMCDGRLEELYIERATAASNVGNIYKGRVTNVEPSIQAAFIDFGLPLHGFLHISDLHPKYFPDSHGEPEQVGKKTPRRHRPPIQNCLRRGQELVVQVIKEGIGTKGPTLSSYISLPGRFLVMMPDMEQLGVSRKIENDEQRRKLREALGQLSLPKDMGFIVRTAGVDRPKKDLQRDLNYLTRLWRKVEVRLKKEPAPAELYKESDLVIRTIRDLYDSNLGKIVVDSPAVATRVRDFLSIASPRSQDVVSEYSGAEPMFHRYGIESEIDKLHSRQVPLVCGGSLVIEQTEALVAIDVNSGRFRIPENAEETAYRVNLEAVDEIARQLRLRDLGGLIICDLIDMGQEKHRRAVERKLADALKKHKERAKLLRISKFGILEMTRQRQRPSFAKSIYRDCPRCNGSGRVKTPESAGLDVMRQIRLASNRPGVASVDVSVSPMVAADLLNRKRHQLTDLERATGQTIRIHANDDLNVDDVQVSCTDRRGREVPASPTELDSGRPAPGHRPVERPAPRVESPRPPALPVPPAQANNHGRPGGRRRGGRRRGRHGGGGGSGGGAK